jgi:uncharacterized protein with von Willebrand factor type A (vWA) domain
MPMNGLFWAARTRAVETIEALGQPGCSDQLLSVVEFGSRAALVEPSRVSELEWDYDYGSNLADALRLGQSCLNGPPGQIVLLSDLFASAHMDQEGEDLYSCPLATETLDRTVEAILSCGDTSITIEAVRYRSGETCQDEERPVALVVDAILANSGTVEDVYIEDAVRGRQPPWRYCP